MNKDYTLIEFDDEKQFDYKKSTAKEFKDKLLNIYTKSFNENSHYILVKSAIIYQIGINDFANWRKKINMKDVKEADIKYQLLNIAMSRQEQNIVNAMLNPKTDRNIRSSLERIYGQQFAGQYGNESYSKDNEILSSFNEKFNIILESKGKLE